MKEVLLVFLVTKNRLLVLIKSVPRENGHVSQSSERSVTEKSRLPLLQTVAAFVALVAFLKKKTEFDLKGTWTRLELMFVYKNYLT